MYEQCDMINNENDMIMVTWWWQDDDHNRWPILSSIVKANNKVGELFEYIESIWSRKKLQ